MLTNLCNYKSRFVRWTMSGLGQVSFVAGHPAFSLFNPHFPMFFLWFHDDLPWFPYGFLIVSMFRVVCVACGATTSCCGPPWCPWWQMRAMYLFFFELAMGGYGSLTSKYWDLTGKTLQFLRIASFCLIEFCGGIDVLTLANYLDFYIFPTT